MLCSLPQLSRVLQSFGPSRHLASLQFCIPGRRTPVLSPTLSFRNFFSSTTSHDKEKAFSLLQEAQYFKDLSPDLQRELAEKMTSVQVPDGHTFFHEGKDIHSVLLLEEGTIERSKRLPDDVDSTDDTGLEAERSAIVVDSFEGRGHVSGMLHNFQDPSLAYATVTARGPVQAWLLEGTQLRQVLASNPDYSLQMIMTLAQHVRKGNKLLRAMQKGSAHADQTDDIFRVLCYDTTSWVSEGFGPAVTAWNENSDGKTLVMDYTSERLDEKTATQAAGYDAVCLFVNDTANASVLHTLSSLGVRMVSMRSAGFDRVDTQAAQAFGMTVTRVPAYSPYAVAELAVALMMSVNRKITKASNRVKMANFTLDSALLGCDVHGKTVGVMGTGKIGQIICNIMLGFGCNLLCYDAFENDNVKKAGGTYVSEEEILAQSDILFLMMPLLPETKYTINEESVDTLKKGMILINTSRGGLVDTKALLKGLQNETIAGVGMDVYENEQEYFFQDWSARNIPDADLVALMGNNNVVMTAHQAFFTKEAVDKIVDTTIGNFGDFYVKQLTGFDHPNNCIPKPN